jgi:hypothetical protein
MVYFTDQINNPLAEYLFTPGSVPVHSVLIFQRQQNLKITVQEVQNITYSSNLLLDTSGEIKTGGRINSNEEILSPFCWAIIFPSSLNTHPSKQNKEQTSKRRNQIKLKQPPTRSSYSPNDQLTNQCTEHYSQTKQ